MEAVDWSEKWVYKGSSTQPPCKQHVYWQVLRTVYPIKFKYLEGLKFLLTQNHELIPSNKNNKAIASERLHSVVFVSGGKVRTL